MEHENVSDHIVEIFNKHNINPYLAIIICVDNLTNGIDNEEKLHAFLDLSKELIETINEIRADVLTQQWELEC